MNAIEAVEELKKGNRVTISNADTGIFYRMYQGDLIVTLNTNGCQNKITAFVDRTETVEQFVKSMSVFQFKTYE